MQPLQSRWLDPICYDLDSRGREGELVRVRQGGMECAEKRDVWGQMPVADTEEKLDDLEPI